MEDEELVATGNEAARAIDFSKYTVLARFSVEIGIDEADDAALTRTFAEGAKKIHADEDLAFRRCGEAGGRGREIAAGEGGEGLRR